MSVTRRGALALLAMEINSCRDVRKKDDRPSATIIVLDDSRGQAPMATIVIWLQRGYSIKDVVRQQAQDLGVCGERVQRRWMQKPGRSVMLDNLAAGITEEELYYLIRRIGTHRVYEAVAKISDEAHGIEVVA